MQTRLKLVVIALLMGLYPSLVFAQEQWEGWKKIRMCDGITGYVRKNPRSPVNESKAIGLVEAPVAAIEAVVRDIPAEKDWMFMCSKAYKIDPPNLSSAADSYYSFFRQGLPWPVSDRIAVMKHELSIDKASGTLTLVGKGVPVEVPGQEKGGVRLPLVEVSCIMKPITADKTEVTYQILADVGGSIPTPVIQMLSDRLSVDTMKNVRKMVAREPYRSARTVITTTVKQ